MMRAYITLNTYLLFPSFLVFIVFANDKGNGEVINIGDIEPTTINYYNLTVNNDTKYDSTLKIDDDNTTDLALESIPTSLSIQLNGTSLESLLSTSDINLLTSTLIPNINASNVFNKTIETGEKRKTNANPSVDDIISGLIQLIGGNVKLTRPPLNQKLPLIANQYHGNNNNNNNNNNYRPSNEQLANLLHATRINNRGPPKVAFIGAGAHHIPNLVPPSILIAPGMPAGVALPLPPTHLARLPVHLNIAPTKPALIIPESDVSFLLGLMKPNIKDEKEFINVKNVQKVQSSKIHDKIKEKPINTLMIMNEKNNVNPTIEHNSTQHSYYSINSHNSLANTDIIIFNLSTSISSEPHIPDIASITTQTSHQTDISLPSLQSQISSFIIPIQPESPLPTGPITAWVPVYQPSSLKTVQFPSDEPVIITMPDEPSVYQLTVKHQIGPTNTLAVNAITTKNITINDVSNIERTFDSVSAENITLFTSLTTVKSAANDVTKTKTNINITNTLNTTTLETVEPEIVYGRPESINYNKPIAPSFTTNYEEIITISGSHKTTFESSTKPSITAVGRPIVVPVEMDEVKPQVGPNKINQNNRQQPLDSAHQSRLKNSGNAPTLQVGSGVIVNGDNDSNDKNGQILPSKPVIVRRPPFRPRPNVPIVRIDTCIVGDDTTCEMALNEKCLTELGLSSCQCRPGYSRNVPRTPCIPVISLALSLKVDRIGDKKLMFNRNFLNADTEDYQYLEYESLQAINSVFSLSKLTRVFLGAKVNRFYSVAGKTIVNATINLEHNNATVTSSIKRYVQQELSRIIAIRNNNIGESQLWVEGSLNAIPRVEDMNECSNSDLNDCSKFAKCINEFGTFKCECESGYEDKYSNDKSKSGRFCSACSPQYCSNRGECLIVKGQRECKCKGNFIGSKCDIDAEVLGVALGGSVAALIIIIITFLCLYMWNQRWKKEQQKMEAMSAASGHTFSYVNKQAATAYRLTIDDRMRWAQIAEAMANNPGYSTNYYVNAEQLATSQHHLNHVYATPTRVQTTGTLLNDDLCAYESRQYSRSLRPKSRTASSTTPHGYTLKSGAPESVYNETEFSTREMIYSPTHLISAPRSQFSYS